MPEGVRGGGMAVLTSHPVDRMGLIGILQFSSCVHVQM